ncbi:hypothetical protein BXZ70DRAFT_594202 [Cristinia sonorae]|uniref:NudC domain-containing protein 1 n=1 Tax=Cristinia sonorae TaxID=1940300 RepID=A0A8K0UWF0_9AGAR|nr:hypothetical protein BXZ70DRAFT_594202 [Cristinia sonorae]
MFEPIRALLNPKFEGYKLDALDQEQAISRFPLRYQSSQTTVSGRVPLSFQEVQSRIRHNHLVVGPARKAVYVDAEFRVISITVDEASITPSFEVIYELSRPIQTDSQDLPHHEYPSVAFLDTDTLFVSDGFGTLYALKVAADGPARLLNTFELTVPETYDSSQRNVPFRVHLAEHTASGAAVVILSSKHYPSSPESTGSTKKRSQLSNTKFDIWAAQVDLSAATQESALPLEIKWHRRGEDVPQYIAHDASREAFMLLGSSPYRTIRTPAAAPYEPTSDEIAPIPRAGDNLDGQPTTPAPPPYSWTQTSDSVTIAFPLPSTTPKHAIKVTFSPRTLTVLVAAESPSPSVSIPKYTAKTLWDGIQPSTSFWTWDKDDSRSFGVLTLHLDKQHEGTRWVQVFASAGAKASSTPSAEDVEVPETLDPSELYNIRENMEKFTDAIRTGTSGIPSLAEGEMDEEIDSEMGKWSFISWVKDDGEEPSWGNDRGMDAPISILSTPFPGLSAQLPSIVVKNGVDGVVFTLERGTSPSDAPSWKHTSTFSALSFVLASKRDTRFVHHVSSKAVLAFESGAQGNVYMYRNTVGVHEKHAKQAILKIASGMAGSLLGVGILETTQHHFILGLCEGEMVVAHDVL